MRGAGSGAAAHLPRPKGGARPLPRAKGRAPRGARAPGGTRGRPPPQPDAAIGRRAVPPLSAARRRRPRPARQLAQPQARAPQARGPPPSVSESPRQRIVRCFCWGWGLPSLSTVGCCADRRAADSCCAAGARAADPACGARRAARAPQSAASSSAAASSAPRGRAPRLRMGACVLARGLRGRGVGAGRGRGAWGGARRRRVRRCRCFGGVPSSAARAAGRGTARGDWRTGRCPDAIQWPHGPSAAAAGAHAPHGGGPLHSSAVTLVAIPRAPSPSRAARQRRLPTGRTLQRNY